MTRYSNSVKNMSLLDHCLEVAQVPPRESSPRPTSRLIRLRLSDTDRATIIESYRSGITAIALAQEFAVSDYSIRQILQDAGVPKPRWRTPVEKRTQARELLAAGRNLSSVAREVGISRNTARSISLDLKGLAQPSTSTSPSWRPTRNSLPKRRT